MEDQIFDGVERKIMSQFLIPMSGRVDAKLSFPIRDKIMRGVSFKVYDATNSFNLIVILENQEIKYRMW